MFVFDWEKAMSIFDYVIFRSKSVEFIFQIHTMRGNIHANAINSTNITAAVKRSASHQDT